MCRLADNSRRPNVLLAALAVAVVVVVALVVAGNLRSRPASDCDTVRDMLADNRQFTEQTKTSAQADNPELATADQYRDWAARLADYAARVRDPGLSARSKTAADLAGQTADLVPKYRTRPDDVEVRRQYARIGIEFANAVTGLEYACPDPGS